MKLMTVEEMRAAIAEAKAKTAQNTSPQQNVAGKTTTDLPVTNATISTAIEPTISSTTSDSQPINTEQPSKVKKMIECESCDNKIFESDALKFLSLTLCQECYDKEKVLQAESKAKEPERLDEYHKAGKFVEALNNSIKEAERAADKNYEQYFNAEMVAISEIEGTLYERAEKVKERIDSWGKLLFEVQTKRNTAHGELNKIAAKLTQEEREKLRVQFIAYEPKEVIIKDKVRVERKSKEDKAIDSMVKTMYGPKLLTGDRIIKEMIYPQHNDWFDSSGLPKKEHLTAINDIVIKNGGMTYDFAVAQMKETIRNSKAIKFQHIVDGKKD